ncbi:hypothetical protein ACPTG3_13545, partial [Enterococcus faecium]|uniref:hypothetical protein n=1 Tax=Enterococcus faecium TaxID=1352 RepID=UPI003CC5CCF3
RTPWEYVLRCELLIWLCGREGVRMYSTPPAMLLICFTPRESRAYGDEVVISIVGHYAFDLAPVFDLFLM